MSNSSIWPIDRTLSDATTLGQSGPGSNGNEGVLHILQSTSIIGASPSDCLKLYPGYLFGVGPSPLQKCSQCILQPLPTELCEILGSKFTSTCTITFRVIPLEKVWISFSPSYELNSTTSVLLQLVLNDLCIHWLV